MDVNALVQTFITPPTIFLCLTVAMVTWFFRKVIESTWRLLVSKGIIAPKVLLDRLWNELAIPTLPLIVGGSLGFMAKTITWPGVTNGTLLGRVLYGAICGMFSAYIYNRVRSWIKSKPEAEEVLKILPENLEEPDVSKLSK